MPKPIPPLWSNLHDLTKWIERNCNNCRYLTGGHPGLPPHQRCPVPHLTLRSTIYQSPTPTCVLGILYPPHSTRPFDDPPHPPDTCGSRKDKRGRPRKAEKD